MNATLTEVDKYFIYKSFKGLKEKGLSSSSEHIKRLTYEINVIVSMGFSGYFLVVQDYIQEAKSKGILVGPGRGSGVGSLVCYCLRITNLDPVPYNLYFERFLNPSRVSMPDLDIDFDQLRRGEIIDYVKLKYGEEYVSRIGTFGTLKAKASVKAAARVLGLPFAEANRLSGLTLQPVHGKPQPLKSSIERIPELLTAHRDPQNPYHQVLRLAEKIEDLTSDVGVHASGLVISPLPIVNKIPLYKNKDGEATTQWDMNEVEEAGLVKFDFLGLLTLTKMSVCLDILKKTRGIDVDIDSIDIEDADVYQFLRNGNTQTVFQLETSAGIQDLLVRIGPTCLEDLSAVIAIFRPGPLASDGLKDYLECRATGKPPHYLLPALEPALKETSAFMIYQEQSMKIAVDLCSFTPSEADTLRKAMGKKKADLMASLKEKFITGGANNGHDKDAVETIWNNIAAGSEYLFNKSHSLAYALISYQTAYLKYYYPTEWMCANLICDQDDQSQIIKYLSDSKKMGITISPPHVNKSLDTFSVVSNRSEIVFGLAPIKGLGIGTVNSILEERKLRGPFLNIKDFYKRIDHSNVNSAKVEALIKAGALDGLGPNRLSMLEAVTLFHEYRNEYSKYERKLTTYHRKIEKYNERLNEIKEGSKKKPFKDPPRPMAPIFPEMKHGREMSKNELLETEYNLLGYYISGHPLDDLEEVIAVNNLLTVANLPSCDNGQTVEIIGVFAAFKEVTTKTKKQIAFALLEDKTGQVQCSIFSKVFAKYKNLLKDKKPYKIKAKVEVVETDGQEDSLAKLVVLEIRPVAALNLTDFIDLEINATPKEVKALLNVVLNHIGGQHLLRINLRLGDNTKVIFKDLVEIGDKDSFINNVILRLPHATISTARRPKSKLGS